MDVTGQLGEHKIQMNLTKQQLNSYDHIIVAFSGGKDSLACVLHLIEQGADKSKIELWHHDVDGREGSNLMDWPITRSYCRAVADVLELPIYFSWKQGGFEREMLRKDSRTAPISFECPDGTVKTVGGTRGKLSTRMKFPQVSPDLSVRWCSAYLKIDVGACAIRNQDRFTDKRTLFVSGERAEESKARANYKIIEPDRSDNREGKRIKRLVDRYRPVHSWKEAQVWDIIKDWSIRPHPCYELGWGRCSCATCIFGSKDQWASIAKVSPDKTLKVAEYEEQFGLTINRTEDVLTRVEKGKAYPATNNEKLVKLANQKGYTEDIIMQDWKLPAGAFGESCGPS